MKNYLVLLLLAFTFTTFSQNTIKLDTLKESPKANIEQVSWISGQWYGEALGGITE